MPRKGQLIKKRLTRAQYRLSQFSVSYPEKGVARVRNKTTNEIYRMPKEQFDRIRNSAGKYESTAQMEKAFYWASTLGDDERKVRAIQNLEGVLWQFDIPVEEKQQIIEMFSSLTDDQRQQFWEENEWLVRQTYNYYRELIDVSPDTATFGVDVTEGYLNNPENRATLERMGAIGKKAQPEIVNRLYSALSKYR